MCNEIQPLMCFKFLYNRRNHAVLFMFGIQLKPILPTLFAPKKKRQRYFWYSRSVSVILVEVWGPSHLAYGTWVRERSAPWMVSCKKKIPNPIYLFPFMESNPITFEMEQSSRAMHNCRPQQIFPKIASWEVQVLLRESILPFFIRQKAALILLLQLQCACISEEFRAVHPAW